MKLQHLAAELQGHQLTSGSLGPPQSTCKMDDLFVSHVAFVMHHEYNWIQLTILLTSSVLHLCKAQHLVWTLCCKVWSGQPSLDPPYPLWLS